MIHGVGTDIIEIKRIEASITRFGQRFLDRLFTTNEQAYCLSHRDPHPRFAGRFAAKEAVVKALGTGFRDGISWLDIEILNDSQGKPSAILSPELQEAFNSPKIHLSISHCRDYATAFAVVL
jgi:holo-[acyl-carrier protein] synthase